MPKDNIFKPKHTKDIITWDIPVDENAAEKHQERVSLARDKAFEESNKQVYNDMLLTYEEFSTKFENGTNDEQIMLLSRFHQVREYLRERLSVAIAEGYLVNYDLSWQERILTYKVETREDREPVAYVMQEVKKEIEKEYQVNIDVKLIV